MRLISRQNQVTILRDLVEEFAGIFDKDPDGYLEELRT